MLRRRFMAIMAVGPIAAGCANLHPQNTYSVGKPEEPSTPPPPRRTSTPNVNSYNVVQVGATLLTQYDADECSTKKIIYLGHSNRSLHVEYCESVTRAKTTPILKLRTLREWETDQHGHMVIKERQEPFEAVHHYTEEEHLANDNLVYDISKSKKILCHGAEILFSKIEGNSLRYKLLKTFD